MVGAPMLIARLRRMVDAQIQTVRLRRDLPALLPLIPGWNRSTSNSSTASTNSKPRKDSVSSRNTSKNNKSYNSTLPTSGSSRTFSANNNSKFSSWIANTSSNNNSSSRGNNRNSRDSKSRQRGRHRPQNRTKRRLPHDRVIPVRKAPQTRAALF